VWDVRSRLPRWLDYLVYPALLAVVGYVTVVYVWDPQPFPHSCPSGTSVAQCEYAVGLVGHGATWLVPRQTTFAWFD
jgi:hypothetical protein